jgi:hypothetical protein
MSKYFALLVENGVDDMEVVEDLTEEHLADMGIPLGHRIKFLKRIKELQETQADAKEETVLPAMDEQEIATEPPEISVDVPEVDYKEALAEFRVDGKENKVAASSS